MIPFSDIPMVEAMEKYGGGFVKALANALRHADYENYRRLRSTFPEYFTEYRKMSADKNP